MDNPTFLAGENYPPTLFPLTWDLPR
jgi:hypothetical protein